MPSVDSASKKVAVELDPSMNAEVNPCERDLETAVACHGPVAVTLFFPNAVQLTKFSMTNFEDVFYEPGPYDNKQIEAHAVLVVGYGVQRNRADTGYEKYWIIKNSYGDDENTGYHKLAKDRGNNCYVAACAMYPVVKKIALVTRSIFN